MLLAAACASDGNLSSSHPARTASLESVTLTSTPPRAPLSMTLVIPSTTMKAGASMQGQVVVENDTGRARYARGGCVWQFAVALSKGSTVPAVAQPACDTGFKIPAGQSSWPVSVDATYDGCGGPGGPYPPCTHNRPPPLPPGVYRAWILGGEPTIPPRPTLIRVTP
jgi:hypothetical protein